MHNNALMDNILIMSLFIIYLFIFIALVNPVQAIALFAALQMIVINALMDII